MNILVIRTDNIGDLVCTTPLLARLRQDYPEAWIGVLANSYSAPALIGHPAVDEVIIYHKAKHLEEGSSALGSYVQRLKTVLRLRQRRIDLVLIPAVAGQASARRFARWLGAKDVIANEDSGVLHEVEKVYALMRRLPGKRIEQPIPPCQVIPDAVRVEALRKNLALPLDSGGRLRVGLHISARKPSQRWPAGCFVEFAHRLTAHCPVEFLLFWSPGDENDPRHPGDDRKAAEILRGVTDLPVHAVPTSTLPELIAGLSLCDYMVQSDGGAMHLAAALGKPIVCFFGHSDARRWHPWAVPYELLQPVNEDVATLTASDVFDAFLRLQAKTNEPGSSRRCAS